MIDNIEINNKSNEKIINDEYIRSEAKAIYNYVNRENYNVTVLLCMISELKCLISKTLYGNEYPTKIINEIFDRKKEKENEQLHKN